jgi:acetyl esterase/lipase
LSASIAAGARDKPDLNRLAPVPATEPVPMMDFFRPSLLQSPALNPSGTHVAALVTVGKDRHDLLVYDMAKKEIEMLHGNGDKDIYSVTWLNDSRLIYLLADQKLYGLAMMIGTIGRLTESFPVLQYTGARMVSVPERNRLRPLVWMSFDMETGKDRGVAEINTDLRAGALSNLRNSSTSMSDVLDVRDNNEKHITKAYPVPKGGMGAGYMGDRDGELAFAFTTENGIQTLHRLTGEKWEVCPVNLDDVDVISAGDAPGQIVVLAPREPGKPRALRFMDAATGELGATLVQDNAYDFRGWVFRDPRTRDIVGAIYQRGGPQTVWFRDDYRAAQKMVEASFPKQTVRILDVDNAGRFLVSTSSDRQPDVFHWVDLEKRTMGLIKNSAPWIDPTRMQPMNVMAFKTRDGGKLDAYVTLPAGASKTNRVPLIVLPHGGPWVRDTWGFNGEVQYLASLGYAVLQPNYRGSLGYDWVFPEDDKYEFKKMHDDVTDATKAVLRTGMIDPDRIAIMGGSFGAYLALSGVVHEPTLYRCAVTIAGVFDWEQVLKDSKYDQYSNGRYAYLKRRLGDPQKQKEKYEAVSPGRHVAQVRVPVFVAHGKDDPVASVNESKRLISELKRHDVPHESLFISGEGHGMGHLKNQLELYSRIEVFLQKNLAPRASSQASSP